MAPVDGVLLSVPMADGERERETVENDEGGGWKRWDGSSVMDGEPTRIGDGNIIRRVELKLLKGMIN